MFKLDCRQTVRDRIVDAEVKKLELRQAQARLQQAGSAEKPAASSIVLMRR